jgi:serine/threonine-protein kinase RsbW
MTGTTLVSRPKHADGWAHQVSESPPGTGTASAANPDGQTAACQHPSARAVEARSPRTWSRSFRATADQVRGARQFLAEVLGASPPAADALTCLSELATNSVLHSNSRRPGGSFAVHASLRSGVLRVEVEDEGGPWESRNEPDGHGGRGLAVVDGLSSNWSISGDGNGARTVWFEISYP